MDTYTIKIRDEKALKLIRDLESLNLIQVVSKNSKEPKPALSSILSGSISEEEANTMQVELKKMKDEWQRDS